MEMSPGLSPFITPHSGIWFTVSVAPSSAGNFILAAFFFFFCQFATQKCTNMNVNQSEQKASAWYSPAAECIILYFNPMKEKYWCIKCLCCPPKRLLDPATRSISNEQKQFIKSIAINRGERYTREAERQPTAAVVVSLVWKLCPLE